MIIVAAAIWLSGLMFTWGWCTATYLDIDDVTWRDWATLALGAPIAWPVFIVIFVKARLG
jgi:hypothetical protein